MKIWFTELTRPSSASGVRDCNNVLRITTLTMSNIPLAISSPTDR